jgi:hypothetical protein
MARYLASAGIRNNQGGGDDLGDYPYIVLIGPSGQFVQIHGPSGVTDKDPEDTKSLQAVEQTHNHCALAWGKNEIVYSLRAAWTLLKKNYQYAWMPYGMPSGAKINPAAANTILIDGQTSNADGVMFDGYEHKIITPFMPDGNKELSAFYRLPNGDIFWTFGLSLGSLIYGTYKGDDPIYVEDGSRSGWKPRGGQYGHLLSTTESNFKTGSSASFPAFAGIVTSKIKPASVSDNVCDIIYHKGTIYIAYQYKVVGINIGGKGSFIFNDYIDERVDHLTVLSNYTDRAVNASHTNSSKSFAEHEGILYMLQNDGKVYSVSPGGLKLISDLSALGTVYSSGVFGGTLPTVTGAWGGTGKMRCYMTKFNGQLHAFLNYSITDKVVKGTDGVSAGRGVFWGTSWDGVNWTDQTPNMPGSGIHPTSGSLGVWATQTNPYIFSGRTGYNRDQYSIWQALASGIGNQARPSGLRQWDTLPWFDGSGTLMDAPGTTWDNLNVPLNHGAISGHLGPTYVAYPPSFQTVSGVFGPTGTAASGWDFTNCHNYHISGFNDQDNDVLHLIFTEDFHGEGEFGSTLYYELNKSSGWNRKNWVRASNQLNGLIPIDLYNPEVIVPSGDLYNPNPRIDEVNKTIRVDFNIYDWPYWNNVNVTMEYSIDGGQSWYFASKKKNISTGSEISDPSGVIGVQDTITWTYTNQLSKNVYYPNVQVRLRAEAI